MRRTMNEIDAISVATSMYDDGYNKGREDAINEFAERVARTDINTSNYPMNQVTLVKMQMLKEQKNDR